MFNTGAEVDRIVFLFSVMPRMNMGRLGVADVENEMGLADRAQKTHEEQAGTSERGSYGSCDVNSLLKPTATLA